VDGGTAIPSAGRKITKMVNVRYDLSADCPKWKQFVPEIMNYKDDLNKQATGNDQLTARWLKR
jgi:hypothetical protein